MILIPKIILIISNSSILLDLRTDTKSVYEKLFQLYLFPTQIGNNFLSVIFLSHNLVILLIRSYFLTVASDYSYFYHIRKV